jgi:hypothetical protein
VKQSDTDVKALDYLFCFNFTTTMTVGYGDYRPVSLGRVGT